MDIFKAIRTGNFDEVKALLENPENKSKNFMNAIDPSSQKTATELAISVGALEIFMYLVDAGSNIFHDEERILKLAVDSGDAAILSKLKAEGVNFSINNNAAFQHLLRKMRPSGTSGYRTDLLQLMMTYCGCDANFRDPLTDKCPLNLAAAAGDIDFFNTLIDLGADMIETELGLSLIVDAIYSNSPQIIDRVFEVHNDQDVYLDLSRDSGMLLTLAMDKRCLEILDQLLAYGADVHVEDDALLRHAITPEKFVSTSMLSDDTERCFPIEYFKLLMNWGANITWGDDALTTLAKEHGRSEILQILEENQEIYRFLKDRNVPDEALSDFYFNSTLRRAIQHGFVQNVKDAEAIIRKRTSEATSSVRSAA